jgi:hypothetical protein
MAIFAHRCRLYTQIATRLAQKPNKIFQNNKIKTASKNAFKVRCQFKKIVFDVRILLNLIFGLIFMLMDNSFTKNCKIL